MQTTSGYSPKMMAAGEPSFPTWKIESSGVSTASTSAAASPDLRFIDEPNVHLIELQGEPNSPSNKTEMSKDAMTLFLPGLKRMRRDATSFEEKRKLTEEIDAIESKLGVASACPETHKCVVSRISDRADDSVESRRARATSDGAMAELTAKKDYAAIMLPGLRRMRQSAPMEERARLNQEIVELEKTLGVSNPADVMKFAVSRREDRDDADGAHNAEASSDASRELCGVVPEAGQSTEMSVEMMTLLLPGLKRLHRDATSTEERSQLTEEIDAMEAILRSAGFNEGSMRRAVGADKEGEMSREFANLMLPGLRRMRHSASSEDRTRLDQEITKLEGHIGVAPTSVETAKCVVSRREDRD